MISVNKETTSTITYRIYQNSDLEGVLELWEKFSGWGAITEKQFNDWYIDAPYGSCIIILAKNENDEVVGQTILTRSIMHVCGQEVKALRVSAPILHASIQQTNIKKYDHPVFEMFRYGIGKALEEGYKIAYSFPSRGWTALFKLFPKFDLPEIQIAHYDCFGISLEDASTFIETNKSLTVTKCTEGITKEYDDLWNNAVINFPISCGVVRNAAWLTWKLDRENIYEVREGDKLKGYMAFKKNSTLIVDMLARTKEELEQVFFAVVHSIHTLNPNRIPTARKKITGMYTPLSQFILSNIKFYKEDFKFAFGCYPLDSSFSNQLFNPNSWYMMPND
jgi:hypothetical protein